MDTNYRIKGIDISEIFENFPTDIATQYGVTTSRFTDASGKFKKGGQPLKKAIGKVIPTSAGASYNGGAHSTSKYKTNGAIIDVALKGCRPIGILLAELGVGEHFINRVNGQTWLSTSANSATGTRLVYDPKYIFIELQGGGGGGAGSGLTRCSAGGGGGGYAFIATQVPDNSYLRIVVGAAGLRGEADSNGGAGGTTYLYDATGNILAQANGGGGGERGDGNAGSGGTAIGKVTITGGSGGKKENNGSGVEAFNVTLPKPEQTVWTRGSYSGGGSNGNNYGGGGGASAFADGAAGDSRKTPTYAGWKGSGGAGGGYTAFNESPGVAGGEGFGLIYY